MIFLLIVVAALSFFAPSEPMEPPQEPPPVVETVEAVETHVGRAATGSKLESVAGLATIACCGCVGFRLARLDEKRKSKRYVKTDNVQFALLMRRLNDMAAIMEAVKSE